MSNDLDARSPAVRPVRSVRTRKASQAAASRAKLIASARRLFEAKGYSATSTEEVLQATGLTRGALYHHFRDKQALFAAVCEAIHGELIEAIERATDGTVDAHDSLRRGSQAWLMAAADPRRARILLVDAPAVLGTQAWREVDQRHGFAALRQAVKLTRSGRDTASSRLKVDAHSVALNGAINELATWVAGDASRLKPALAALDAVLVAAAGKPPG